MNKKDRQIQFFLQLFLLITGVYLITFNSWKLGSGTWENGIFEFYNEEIPVFKLTASFITGTMTLIASWVLWVRASWAYGFTLLVAGLLFSLNLIELGEIIYSDPYQAIPMVIILIVMLQSTPFLIRRAQRHA